MEQIEFHQSNSWRGFNRAMALNEPAAHAANVMSPVSFTVMMYINGLGTGPVTHTYMFMDARTRTNTQHAKWVDGLTSPPRFCLFPSNSRT